MDMDLPQFLSVSAYFLIVILTIVAGFAAFSKRSALLGGGFLLLGFAGLVGWIFNTFFVERLYMGEFFEFTDPGTVISWFWLLNNVFSLLAHVLLLAGVFKLLKPE